MKTRKYYYIFSLLAFIYVANVQVLGHACTACQNDTIIKEISEEIPIDPSIILDIDFSTDMPSLSPTISDIFEIYTWEKEIIKRVVTVKVDPVDPEEANNFIKHLKFSKLQLANKTVNLNLSSGVRRIHAGRKKWVVEMVDGKEFTINGYNIKICLYIPKKNELILKSNLSKISLGNLTNKAILDLRSVRLKANNINELSLKAYNSEIQINKVNKAVIQANRCEINSNFINSTKIVNSKFTDYILTEVGDLEIIDSKEDKYTIRHLNNINCKKSIFSNYYINRLNTQLDITCQNGDIFIDYLNKDFSEININNSFSIIKIGSEDVSNLLLNTNTKLTEYFFSNEINTINEKKELDYKIGRYYKGSKSATQLINIECIQCEINLK